MTNKVEAARALVEHGASMICRTYPDSNMTSPLAKAVSERRAEIVQLFVSKGAIPDEKIHGNIIREAVEGGDLPTIKALLSVDPETSPTRHHNYATDAIDHAILRNKVDVIKLLLDLGADITNGEAFRLSLQYSHGFEVAGLLYNHSPTALLPLVADKYLQAAGANNVEALRFWLKNGLPIDVKNKDGETALHAAAKKGAIEAVAALLERDPPRTFVNARSANTGATALYATIDSARISNTERTLKIIKSLVEHGADHRLGLIFDPRARAELDTVLGHVLHLGFPDITAYFVELEKKHE